MSRPFSQMALSKTTPSVLFYAKCERLCLLYSILSCCHQSEANFGFHFRFPRIEKRVKPKLADVRALPLFEFGSGILKF